LKVRPCNSPHREIETYQWNSTLGPVPKELPGNRREKTIRRAVIKARVMLLTYNKEVMRHITTVLRRG
jgi:hypothetical protein